MDPKVTASPDETKPDHLAATVADLRRIADALESIGRLPVGEKQPYLSMSILLDSTDDVDAVAVAVLGKPAKVEASGDSWYHLARGVPASGKGYLCVQTTATSPRESELAKLRAEVAELRAAAKPDFVDGPCLHSDCPNASWPHLASDDLAVPDPTGLGFSREADDPTPVSPARVPLHTGGVVEGGQLVDEPMDVAEWREQFGSQQLAEQTRPQCSPECGADRDARLGAHTSMCPVAHAEAQR